MSASAILAGIAAAREIIGAFASQAAILNSEGVISDEELEEIRREADVSDAAWDAAVDEARDRLERGG